MQNPEPDQPTDWVPHNKVIAGALSGAGLGGPIAVLTVPFILPYYPATVDHDSITAAYGVVCSTIVGFIASYFTTNSRS